MVRYFTQALAVRRAVIMLKNVEYFLQKFVDQSRINATNMRTVSANVKAPALISLAIVFPFILMEIVNRRNLPGEFPYVLFGALWVAMLLFILILKPILKNFHSGVLHITVFNVITRTVFLAALGYFWISLVVDQMPCFLGGTNCD